jgi:gliding motility-associated-like protein
VIVKAVPAPQLPVPDTVIIENGQKIQLIAKDGFMLYQWSPPGALSCADCPDPIANPDSSSTYRLKVTDDNGCTATIEYRILVFPPCDPQRLLVPNAFTPDGDGNNDVFKVVPFEGFEMLHSLVIYNRWGQRIYAGSGPKAGWDGTVDGKPVPADVYVWILEADCGGVIGRQVGDVALIR